MDATPDTDTDTDHATVFLRLGKAYNAATQAFEALTGVGAARWRLLYLVQAQPLVSLSYSLSLTCGASASAPCPSLLSYQLTNE